MRIHCCRNDRVLMCPNTEAVKYKIMDIAFIFSCRFFGVKVEFLYVEFLYVTRKIEGGICLRAISVDDLQDGMILARTVVNPKRIVIISGNSVLTQAHITRLKFLKIPAVYIKDDKEIEEEQTRISSRSDLFCYQYEGARSKAETAFMQVRRTGGMSVAEVKELVDTVLLPLSQRSGVIDYLNEINHLASDVYNHSMRVAILSGVFAKWMHMDMETTKDIVLAGFLHDIGKAKFDPRLLEKDVASLTGEDYERYIQHTIEGAQVLNGIYGLSEGVRLTALQHHERMDGSGFPFNVMGDEIHLYARVVAVADIYDNITTEREGRLRQTPFDAVAEIANEMYGTLAPEVCVPVLMNIKNAFLGSHVLLSNRREGRIISYPHGVVTRPILTFSGKSLFDLNEHPEITILEYNQK